MITYDLKVKFVESLGYKRITSLIVKNIYFDPKDYDDWGKYIIPYSKNELLQSLQEVDLWWYNNTYFRSVDEICDQEYDAWIEFQEENKVI